MLGERWMSKYPANSRCIYRSLLNRKPQENPRNIIDKRFLSILWKLIERKSQNVVRTIAFLAFVRSLIVAGSVAIYLCFSR